MEQPEGGSERLVSLGCVYGGVRPSKGFSENSRARGHSITTSFFKDLNALKKKLLRTYLIPGTSHDLGLDDPL